MYQDFDIHLELFNQFLNEVFILLVIVVMIIEIIREQIIIMIGGEGRDESCFSYKIIRFSGSISDWDSKLSIISILIIIAEITMINIISIMIISLSLLLSGGERRIIPP